MRYIFLSQFHPALVPLYQTIKLRDLAPKPYNIDRSRNFRFVYNAISSVSNTYLRFGMEYQSYSDNWQILSLNLSCLHVRCRVALFWDHNGSYLLNYYTKKCNIYVLVPIYDGDMLLQTSLLCFIRYCLENNPNTSFALSVFLCCRSFKLFRTIYNFFQFSQSLNTN